MITNLKHRHDFGEWLNANGLTGNGAEIGCAFGAYAKILMGKWKGKSLLMIDPWERQDPNVYREGTNNEAPFNGWYEEVIRLASTDPRIHPIKGYSIQVAPSIENGSLDFAYLDGNHSYRAVLEDMDAYWEKVKVGGVLGGHDFYDEIRYPYFNEVKSAVTRWASEHKVEFHTTECSSWWMIKN